MEGAHSVINSAHKHFTLNHNGLLYALFYRRRFCFHSNNYVRPDTNTAAGGHPRMIDSKKVLG